MTLSTYIIEGITHYSLHGATGISCGRESQLVQQVSQLRSTIVQKVLEDCQYLNDHFEQVVDEIETSFFWKMRMIAYIAVSPHIQSMSFIPSNSKESQVLFVQKGTGEEGIKGYIAPYLSEDQMKEWSAVPTVEICHTIYDDQTLKDSINGLDQAVYKDIQTVLEYLLKDQKTAFLGLTYQQGDKMVSQGWIRG